MGLRPPSRRMALRKLGVFSIFLAPSRLRAFARSTELGLALAAGVIGLVSGITVTAMSMIAQVMHELIFGLDAGERLSTIVTENQTVLLIAPIVGGTVMGL